jgi:hypothetical protein
MKLNQRRSKMETKEIKIYDLITGEYVASYSGISPERAVVCAKMQQTYGNFETWNYDFTDFGQVNNKVYSGRFFALKEK